MKGLSRRGFVHLAGAAYLGETLGCPAEVRATASAPMVEAPRLGTITRVSAGGSVDAAIRRVRDLELPTCQIGFDNLTIKDANPLLEALNRYGVEATAVTEHSPGPRVFNFYDGPLTVGIVPPANPYRRARVAALKLAADFARQCNIPAIHTHLGFIPEDPNDPIYPQAIAVIREVAQHCRDQGRMLLCETGEETPIVILRMIRDVGTGNIFVNLDTANLILCDKGNPVDAMAVLGMFVRGIHAKDGLFPTDPRDFGREVPIGEGEVNFAELFLRLKKVNYTGPITIEREIEGPQQDHDIRQSKLFLERLLRKIYG